MQFICFGDSTSIFIVLSKLKSENIKSINQDDHWILQRDINSLMNWASSNKMKFHPSKSHVLTITNAIGSGPDNNFIYAMGNSPINYTDIEKDLGIFIYRAS